MGSHACSGFCKRLSIGDQQVPMDLSSNSIPLFLFLAFVLALLMQWKRPNAAVQKQKLPPSPWKLPFIGNLHHLVGSLPHHALRKLAQKHGPLMHLQLGEMSAIVVSSPRMAEEVMKTHDLAFADRAVSQAIRVIMYGASDIAFAPYGDYWKQMRKICTQELLSARTVQSFGPIRQAEASRLVSSIQALAGGKEPINIAEKLYMYSSSMIRRSAFGKVSRDDQNAFLQIIRDGNTDVKGMEIADLFPSYKFLHFFSVLRIKLEKAMQKHDKVLSNILRQHIHDFETKKSSTGEFGQEDLIDVLLRVRESGDLQFQMTDDNIKAVIMDMFLGGIENSSTTVEWALAEMIRKPDVMAKAQSEIRTAFMGKKIIEETDIQNLRYLKSVIKETLRLHPPVPLLVPRECREQCEIDGYVIPPKTRVMVNAWAIGRDPEYWDDPENFKPERFDNSSIDFMGRHFEYLPFGAGRRICPGISLGLVNIELPLALLLYHFDWKLPNDLKSNELDMTEVAGITARRKNRLCLLATSYSPSP